MKKISLLLVVLVVIGGGFLFYKNYEEKRSSGCNGANIPCNFSEVSDEKFEEGVSLMLGGQELMDEGRDVSEIVNYLNDQAELSELLVGPEAVMFRNTGGPLLVIEAKNRDYAETFDIESIDKVSDDDMEVANAQASENVNVVGADQGDDKREFKKALVLSPYAWDFENDDAPVVQGILGQSRNYIGDITYKENSSDGANAITLGDFTGWGEYDVVHLSTHGLVACKPREEGQVEIVSGGESNLCKTLIDTGFKFANEEDYEKAKAKLSDTPGIAMSKTTLFLTSEFFANNMGELENTIVSFSACEMGRQSDMVAAINSNIENGHFFYWTYSVLDSDALNVFTELYNNLIGQGLDAKKAYDEIDDSLKMNKESSYEIKLKDEKGILRDVSVETGTDFMHLEKGESQHAIETITMLNNDEKIILDGDLYEFVGEKNDAEPDSMNIKFRLKGYTQSEIENENITVSFSIDGEEYLRPIQPFAEADSNGQISVRSVGDREHIVEIKDLEVKPIMEDESLLFESFMNFDGGNYGYHSSRVITSLSDIKGTFAALGAVAVYDDDNKALKLTTPDAEAYMDGEYTYTNVPGQGWVKVNLSRTISGFAGMAGGAGVPNIGGALSDLELMDNETFNFPIVGVAMKLKQSPLEENGITPTEVSCNSGKCQKYDISSAEGNGHLTFDGNGRLVQFMFDGNVIDYEYGEYTVNLPEASELSIPFGF